MLCCSELTVRACKYNTCKLYNSTDCASCATAAVMCAELCSQSLAWSTSLLCPFAAADGNALWLALGAWAYQQNTVLVLLQQMDITQHRPQQLCKCATWCAKWHADLLHIMLLYLCVWM